MDARLDGWAMLALAAAMACVALGASAAEKAPDPKRQTVVEGEVPIQADRFERDPETRRLVGEGHVLAVWDRQRVECERMEWLPPEKPEGSGRFIYEGNVRITIKPKEPKRAKPGRKKPKGWRGTCGTAEYDPATDRIEMKKGKAPQRPRLWRGKTYGEADTIVFIPGQGAFELIGAPTVHGGTMWGLAGVGPSLIKALEEKAKEQLRRPRDGPKPSTEDATEPPRQPPQP